MSAPPGWHLQPDGRERWWDGQQWTDQFRSPLPGDPTAPPADTGGYPDADRTQALDVDRTQQLPTQPPAGGADQSAGGYAPPPGPSYPSPQQYSYPSGGGGVPASGYGSAGGAYPPPQQQGMSGAAKGCLIAAVAGLVILVIAVIGGIFLFNRAADEVSRQIETALPTIVPTEVPSELPSGVPTEVPSLGGEPVTVGIGDGFDLPRATVASGWTIEQGQFSSEVSGMTATYTDGTGLPLAFSMSFEGSGDTVETFCTAAPEGDGGAAVEFVCVPLFGDLSGVDRVTVTPAL
jgi:hypothetical protein